MSFSIDILDLIPILVETKSTWPTATQATFRTVDLLTINELMSDLAEDIRQEEEIQLLRRGTE